MKRKCLFLFLYLSIFMLAFWLGVWTAWAEGYAHYVPDYAKVNIVPILQQERLDAEDYEVLFRQTGMNRSGVDELWVKGRQWDLLHLQEHFFADVETMCLRDFFVLQSERVVKTGTDEKPEAHEEISVRGLEREQRAATKEKFFLPTVQTGDILISFSGHVFGWRNGHAAIVVDAAEGMTLEAITLGSDSRICNINKWAEYPCYALMRLKGISPEEQEKIADYAEENLLGISYRLLSFSGDSKVASAGELKKNKQNGRESLSGTHCAHLVWSAYAHFGYDLDSDGGVVVTPRDIFDSDLLEVVQLYGLNPTVVEME